MSWFLRGINSNGYIDTVESEDYCVSVSAGGNAGSFDIGTARYNRYFYITDTDNPEILQTLVFKVNNVSNPSNISSISLVAYESGGSGSGTVLDGISFGWTIYNNAPRVYLSGTSSGTGKWLSIYVNFLDSSNNIITRFSFTANSGYSTATVNFRQLDPESGNVRDVKTLRAGVGSGGVCAFCPSFIYSDETPTYTDSSQNYIKAYEVATSSSKYYSYDFDKYGYFLAAHGTSNIDFKYTNPYYQNYYYLNYTDDNTASWVLLGNIWVGSNTTSPSASSAGTRPSFDFKSWIYNDVSLSPNQSFRALYGVYNIYSDWDYKARVKVWFNNQWRYAIVNVVHNGYWVIPQKIYIWHNNEWVTNQT